MKLIVDANILVSGLLKDGITRELLLHNDLELFTPEFIYIEFFNHILELAKKAKMDTKLFKEYADFLIAESNIKIMTKKEVIPFINKAENISPDPDDVQYIAAALTMQCAVWSNDKALKRQNDVKILSTTDLIQIMKIKTR
mgnify:FL=1